MARPTELTPEIQEAILKLIRLGNFPGVAASASGIDPRTYYRWMRRGKSGEEPFCQFRHLVKRARDEARVYLVGLAVSAAEKKDPKVALALLERMDYADHRKRRESWHIPRVVAHVPEAPAEKLTDAGLEAKLEQTVRQASEQLAALKSIREQSPRADTPKMYPSAIVRGAMGLRPCAPHGARRRTEGEGADPQPEAAHAAEEQS